MVVIDEYTRECLAIHVARRIRSRDAIDVFADLMETRGIPEHIRSDNVLPIQVKLFDDNRSLLRVVARNLCFSVSDSSRSAVSARFEQDALDHS